MKDALGHGSDPRGGASAHQSGVDNVGRTVYYHGSPIGEPGPGPVHVGTQEAARAALEARIGVRADGKPWAGTEEYGKTKLAGTETQARLEATGMRPKYSMGTGYNSTAPKHDYFPGERTDRATFGDASPIPLEAKPAIHAYSIEGHMSNSPNNPYADARANGMAKRLKNTGVYYRNIGEDGGSVSAVVPSKAYIKRRD